MTILMERDANFTKDEQALLYHVASDDFPWYHNRGTLNFPALVHTIMKRTDEPTEGEPWSPLYPHVRAMFDRLCADNGITVRTIFRMAFNLTFADPSKHGDPHRDHQFPHNNLLIYLNKFDDGETFLFDDDENIVQRITPKVDKFVVWDGQLHANGFCRPQQSRMVFIATFDGDVTPGSNS